jgi:hypothetical protein
MTILGTLVLAAVLAADAPAHAGAAELAQVSGAGAVAGDAYDAKTALIVAGIIEYTRWPVRADPMVLCVAGPAQHASRLDAVRMADGRAVQRRQIPALPSATAGCHALYIGQLDPVATRQMTAAVRGRGVLTIAEADPLCRSQAMFCMVYDPRAINFRMNIDAIARSGLRVDPRVLRLAEGGL